MECEEEMEQLPVMMQTPMKETEETPGALMMAGLRMMETASKAMVPAVRGPGLMLDLAFVAPALGSAFERALLRTRVMVEGQFPPEPQLRLAKKMQIQIAT